MSDKKPADTSSEAKNREFVDAFLVGDLDEIELSLEEYGALVNAVPPGRFSPVDREHFALVTDDGERVLYRKEVRVDAGDHDLMLTVEWNSAEV